MSLRFRAGDRVVVASPIDGPLSPAAQLYAGRVGSIADVNGAYVPYPYRVAFADGSQLAFSPGELTHESEALMATADLSSAPELAASDSVNHPSHYTWLPNGLEVIDITGHFSFVRGNALKYLMRADFKGRTVEDLKKARWYIDYEIRQLEGQQ